MAWNLGIVPKIRNEIKKRQDLKFVLYHDDTMSTAAASIVSSGPLNPKKNFKKVHLEAGLRSGSIFEPFPEEISRRIADGFSDILFAVSDLSAQNLRREKQKGEIIPVGNTIIDSAKYASLLAKKMGINAPSGEYTLATVHQHENIKSKEGLEKIVEILKKVPIKIYFMRYDNTERQLKKFGLFDSLKSIENLKITEIRSYVEFIQWLKNAKILFTDGGSVQEESLVFKVPCIILRKRTERQEGLKSTEGITIPYVAPEVKHVFHQYTIRVENREKLIKRLVEAEIGYGIHYPKPIHKQKLYLNLWYKDRLPKAEKASAEVLSLPVHPALNEEDIGYIISTIGGD